MKKLQLYTGGHPNSLDDYEHIQEGHIESLNAVIAGLIFPNTKTILSGCEFDGTALTEGTVFYNNEVFYVEAQSITASVNDVWFVVEETVRNNTDVTYLDTNQRSVHVERKAKLQAGGGDVQYNTVLRLEDILYSRLGIANLHYTKAQIDNFFGAFRNGYDPTFRINPVNSHLEWSYASPSHPQASGTTQNPWRDLGIPIQYFLSGSGLFQATINTPQILPLAFNQTAFVEFGNEVEDGGGAFNLSRSYTIPVSGTYEFGLDQVELELVNDIVPNQNGSYWVQQRLTLEIWRDNQPLSGAGVTITNGGAASAQLDIDTNGSHPYEIEDAVGTRYNFSGDLRLKANFVAGEQITVQVKATVNTNQNQNGITSQIKSEILENGRVAYRIVAGRFYKVN